MADKTKIAWTDHTFNPWMGCHKVSAGCKHCYAETLVVNRMGAGNVWGASGVRRLTKAPWKNIEKWHRDAEAAQQVKRVFCASLADVFEDYDGPNRWRPQVWELIKRMPWFDFQLLTKRPENIARMLPDDWADNEFGFYPNVWLGASIEDNRVASRRQILTSVPAQVHFISYEPAIGPLDGMTLDGLEWMIVGGESGPGYRPMNLDWARDMKDRCEDEGVAFFFKQSAAPRTEMGIELDGKIVRNYPASWDRIGQAARGHVPEGAAPQTTLAVGS